MLCARWGSYTMGKVLCAQLAMLLCLGGFSCFSASHWLTETLEGEPALPTGPRTPGLSPPTIKLSDHRLNLVWQPLMFAGDQPVFWACSDTFR